MMDKISEFSGMDQPTAPLETKYQAGGSCQSGENFDAERRQRHTWSQYWTLVSRDLHQGFPCRFRKRYGGIFV